MSMCSPNPAPLTRTAVERLSTRHTQANHDHERAIDNTGSTR